MLTQQENKHIPGVPQQPQTAPATAVRMPVYVAKRAVGSEYGLPVTREIMEKVTGKSDKTPPLVVFRHDSIRRQLLGIPATNDGAMDGFAKILSHKRSWERATDYIQGETETYNLVPIFDVREPFVTITVSRQFEIIDGEYTYRLVINDIKTAEGVDEERLSLLSSLASATLVNMFIKESEVLSEELGKQRKILVTEVKPSQNMKGIWGWEALNHMEQFHWAPFAELRGMKKEPESKPYEKWALA